MLVGPQVEILRDELRTLIEPDALWTPILDCDALQCIHHLATALAQSNVERGREAGVVVNDRQNPDLPAIEQLVG